MSTTERQPKEQICPISALMFEQGARIRGQIEPSFNFAVLEDAQLVALVARSDERSDLALSELYDRHSRAVYSLARRMLRDDLEAEEVVQDAFVKLWRNATKFETQRGTVSSWLLTIAHHAAIDAIRGRRHDLLDLEDGEENHTFVTQDQSERNLERVVLESAFDALRDGERELVEMAFLDGFTHQQIAERTGLPLGTVKTRLRSALGRLRNQLEPQFA